MSDTNESPAVDPLLRLADIKQEQAELFDTIRRERLDTLARLALQCQVLGALRRSEIPSGVLIRKERKAVAVTTPVPAPAKRARKAKVSEPTEAAA